MQTDASVDFGGHVISYWGNVTDKHGLLKSQKNRSSDSTTETRECVTARMILRPYQVLSQVSPKSCHSVVLIKCTVTDRSKIEVVKKCERAFQETKRLILSDY